MRHSPLKRLTANRDKGAAAIEFVLVAPFLIALVVAIAQVGMFLNSRIEATSDARNAARSLALGNTPTYASGVTVVSATPPCAPGATGNASVTLQVTYTFSIPFVPLGSRTITTTGTMRCGA
jgi:Flp pilus assembly protein TadG